jgi:hypothetical protein
MGCLADEGEGVLMGIEYGGAGVVLFAIIFCPIIGW